MMNSLKHVINPDPDIVIPIYPLNPRGAGKVILKETDVSAKLKQVEIRGFEAGQTCAFKLDVGGKRISDYLNPSEQKINKACDGVIFTNIQGSYYVFLCEMKSEKPDEQECLLKYRNSTLFIKFIVSILQEFYALPREMEIHYRYVLFDLKKKPVKTPTKRYKIQPEIINDREDNTELRVYKIHRLGKTEFLNIRHLDL